MNADDLRVVAAEIREKANAATTGDGPTLSQVWFSHHDVLGRAGRYEVIARDEGSFIATDLDEWRAAHIAAWHPAVAFAVADWLDAEALHRFSLLPVEIIAFVKAWRGDT